MTVLLDKSLLPVSYNFQSSFFIFQSSSFPPSSRYPLNKGLLGHEEEQYNRQDKHGGGGHKLSPLTTISRNELLQPIGQSVIFRIVQIVQVA
ncbi:MAG: hypothetical protein O7C75_08585 [Verrucomicrobia bacterium]|nr:hypothetical protein [Verrucomicrobiota bacterium]